MKTFAIIPAYNEEKHLREVIQKTKKYLQNIIVVDDGSQDYTSEIAKSEGVTVLKHLVNLGKGAALKTGCDYAVKKGAQNMIALDADSQHNPELIPEFLAKLNNADIVFGYRQFSQTMPFILRFGNWFINQTTNFFHHIKLNDTQCGYRAFTKQAYKKIRWQASDYSMESEMITYTGKHKLRYQQIPIQTIYSDKYKGTTVLDGIKIVFKLVWWRLD